MRQNAQSTQDAQFKSALENMWYKACTPGDLVFLQSMISSDIPGHKSIKDDAFRNASIITSFNVHKDSINQLGSYHFALENNQRLHHFYSEDSVSSKDDC